MKLLDINSHISVYFMQKPYIAKYDLQFKAIVLVRKPTKATRYSDYLVSGLLEHLLGENPQTPIEIFKNTEISYYF